MSTPQRRVSITVVAGVCLIMGMLVGAYVLITEREQDRQRESAPPASCEAGDCISEIEPTMTVAPLSPDVVEGESAQAPKKSTRSKRALALDSKPELLEVPPTTSVRTTEEVTATLKHNPKFRGAIHEGICLVLNDFTRAAGIVKIQLVVPWNGGTESVHATVTWNGPLEREFSDHELTLQDRAAAAQEVGRSLAEHLADSADENVFPARGGGRAVTATITRRFSWDKTTMQDGCSVADAGGVGVSQ